MPNPYRDDYQSPRLPTLARTPRVYGVGNMYGLPNPFAKQTIMGSGEVSVPNRFGMPSAAFKRWFTVDQNPILQGLGGVIGAGLRMRNPYAPDTPNQNPNQPPRLAPVENYARERIDRALGAGWYDRYVKATGESPLQKFRDNPRHLYWDEPNTPDGAISSLIRDEQNNARNAAQWRIEHGDTPIPQEQWERWYYANRKGMQSDDVMSDGSEVVY